MPLAAPAQALGRVREERREGRDADLPPNWRSCVQSPIPAARPRSTPRRAGLYRDSLFKRSLQDFVLWGRQRDPKLALKETKLTQIGARRAGRHVRALVHVQREVQRQLRRARASLPDPPADRIPQPPRAGPVPVSVLAREREVGDVRKGQRAHSLVGTEERPGQVRAVHRVRRAAADPASEQSRRRPSTASGAGPTPKARASRPSVCSTGC